MHLIKYACLRFIVYLVFSSNYTNTVAWKNLDLLQAYHKTLYPSTHVFCISHLWNQHHIHLSRTRWYLNIGVHHNSAYMVHYIQNRSNLWHILKRLPVIKCKIVKDVKHMYMITHKNTTCIRNCTKNRIFRIIKTVDIELICIKIHYTLIVN